MSRGWKPAYRWCAMCRKPLRPNRATLCFCTYACAVEWADNDGRAWTLAQGEPAPTPAGDQG